jgi:hypothetical protein
MCFRSATRTFNEGDGDSSRTASTLSKEHAMRSNSSLTRLVIVLAASGALLGGLDLAQARDRSTTVTGPKGQTATRDVSRSDGDVSSSTTGPNGKSTSRVVDRSPGSTSAVVTGPNGKTASRLTTRTPTGSQTTATGPNGQTASRVVTRTP